MNQEIVNVIEEVEIQEVTAPSAVDKRVVAYTIFIPAVGEFEVAQTYSGWWSSMPRVKALFDAYKQGATDEIACINADISLKQLRYFREAHPEFGQAKEACKAVQTTRFLNALNEKGVDDLPTVRWYLTKRHSDFKRLEKVEPTPPIIQQTVQVAVSQNVDTTKIEDAIARAADSIISNG